VKRWKVEFDDKYLIKIESSANRNHPWTDKPEKEAEKIFSQTFPAIYKHFQRFRDRLIKRDDQGRYYWELRSCKYWGEFDIPKIVYPDIAKRPEFAYDENAFYLVNTLYLLPTDKKWLVGLLNSSVVFWLYTKISTKIRGNFMRFIAQYVSQIPIPNHLKSGFMSKKIIKLLNKIEPHAPGELKILEQEIDAWVAHAYALNEDEYSLILAETNMPDQFRISAFNIFRDIAKGKVK